jgi:hypothetical protein
VVRTIAPEYELAIPFCSPIAIATGSSGEPRSKNIIVAPQKSNAASIIKATP